MKQFHPAFADEADLQAKVDEAGFDTWVELFAVEAFPHMSGNRPTTAAWMPTGTSVADQVFTLIAQPLLLCRRSRRQPAALYRRGTLHLLRRQGSP